MIMIYFILSTIMFVVKIRYINQCPGGNSQQSLNSPIAVHAWVGTPPQLSTVSSLVWRLGSLRIFDETSSFVANISSIQTELGPNYVGNYQSILLPGTSLIMFVANGLFNLDLNSNNMIVAYLFKKS